MNQNQAIVNLETVHKITKAVDKLLKSKFGDATHIEVIAAFHEVIGDKFVEELARRGVIAFTKSENSYVV